jgi:hypothetical protein
VVNQCTQFTVWKNLATCFGFVKAINRPANMCKVLHLGSTDMTNVLQYVPRYVALSFFLPLVIFRLLRRCLSWFSFLLHARVVLVFQTQSNSSVKSAVQHTHTHNGASQTNDSC